MVKLNVKEIKMVDYLKESNYVLCKDIMHTHFNQVHFDSNATGCGSCDGKNCAICKMESVVTLVAKFDVDEFAAIIVAAGGTAKEAVSIFNSADYADLIENGLVGNKYMLIYPTYSELIKLHPDWDILEVDC